MANDTQRVRVEELDWISLLPAMRLFDSFRMAVHPPKLLLGLFVVTFLWLGGQVLDGMSGPSVYRGELERYLELDEGAFNAWVQSREQWTKGQVRRRLMGLEGLDGEDLERVLDSPKRVELAIEHIANHLALIDERIEEAREKVTDKEVKKSVGEGDSNNAITALERAQEKWENRLALIKAAGPQRVFDVIWEAETAGFERLVKAATSLDFGFAQLLETNGRDRDTVAGALIDMAIGVPCWVWARHCWFGLFYLIGALAVWSLLGGTICRIASVQATRNEPVSVSAAFKFTFSRWGWYALTPLVPLLLTLALGLALAAGGMLFNLPMFDIVGGLLYFLALLCGAMVAFLLLLQAAGMHLFYPALATEGTDTFDAISRAFGYVMNRPWQWLFYSLVALVYGAITYVVVGLVVFLTVWFSQRCVGLWVVRDAAEGLNRFQAILPEIRFGQLSYELPWAQMSFSAKLTACLVGFWVHLIFALLGAFVVSFYFSASTWIYLLLRRSCDGTELDDVYIEPVEVLTTPAESQVPVEQAAEPAKEDSKTVSSDSDNGLAEPEGQSEDKPE